MTSRSGNAPAGGHPGAPTAAPTAADGGHCEHDDWGDRMAWTQDVFFDGGLVLRQPKTGFRISVDAVLLGASVCPPKAARVLELGCGPGAALLSVGRRHGDAHLTGVDINPDLLALAQHNLEANGMGERGGMVCADLGDLPRGGAQCDAFEEVLFNPPFYDDPGSVLTPPHPRRAQAFVTHDRSLADWIRVAAKCVRSRGRVTLVHRADRLADILIALAPQFGDIRVKPVQDMPGVDAVRVLVRARKGVKTPMRVCAPLVLKNSLGDDSAETIAIYKGAALDDFS